MSCGDNYAKFVRPRRNISKRFLVNEKIRFAQLRVIGGSGENLGVMTREQALDEAVKKDLDLVVITESANPPVAKILDFNKFLYDSRKKEASARAKSKKSGLKELRFGPAIGDGDLMQRIERAREFLGNGHRVRFTVKLRGREQSHPEIGLERLNRAIKELEGSAKTEADVKRIGNMMTITLVAR